MPFISREKLRQSLVFLIFIAVAFSLWLLKALNEEYETDITVEVAVTGLPPGVELDVDDKSQMQMQVAVHGSGTALIGYMFGDPLKIEVDYSEFNDNNGSLSIPVSQLKNRVSSKLNSYTTLVHFKGESFGVEIKRKLKNLPISVVADLKPAPGYEIKSVKTETEHLLVSAPPSYYSWLKNIEVKKGNKNFASEKVAIKDQGNVVSWVVNNKKSLIIDNIFSSIFLSILIIPTDITILS